MRMQMRMIKTPIGKNMEVRQEWFLNYRIKVRIGSWPHPLTYAVNREALCSASLTSVSGIGSLYLQPSARH